jgi:predicted Zn-dependent protease
LTDLDTARKNAQEALNRADWQTAVDAFAVVLQSEPEEFWANFWTAYAAARLGRHDDAVRMLRELLANGRDPALVRHALVEAYLLANKKAEAVDEYKTLYAEGQIDRKGLHRLAAWVIREMLDTPGFPKSVFDLDESLVSMVRVPDQRAGQQP